MNPVTAVYREGQLQLTSSVDWPDGTPVEVKPLQQAPDRVRWLSLPPLDVGEFRELTGDDDLLGEMLDASRD